ncbi:MAG: group 1 truncated hemoglobin [Chromatiaceae bacterium]|nr:MAG: group 1 truncated hemoglobin [Chromatiaceae bacterium]
MPEASLYERLGGETQIRAIVTDIVANHHHNPTISPRYRHTKRSDAELIDLVSDLIGSGTGGPQVYNGMDMRTAHSGMNINEAEFVAVLDDILAGLTQHGVGEREKAELLAIAYGMKEDIVHL